MKYARARARAVFATMAEQVVDIQIEEREYIRSPENIFSDSSLQRLKRLSNVPHSYDGEIDTDAHQDFRPVKRYKSKRHSKNGVEGIAVSRPTDMTDSKTIGVRARLRSPAPAYELYDVNVTSIDPLPKQMALAKLLRGLEIMDIIKIKYKSSYKVLISFENKEKAELLMMNQLFQAKGFKCQGMDDMDSRYGIVRRVDLEIDDEELKKTFVCEYEIISINRLKRQTLDGKWVDSETVRFCFKGATIPSYVEAYGCRFEVEPYIFPVSQCSGCWRFGHRIKYCPLNKIFCPKCGRNHANCETEQFKCVNCKGDHMSLEKSKCPVFRKEKDIRIIMRDGNHSYKKACQIYEEKSKQDEKDYYVIDLESMEVTEQTASQLESRKYRDALLSKPESQMDGVRRDEGNCSAGEGSGVEPEWPPLKKKKKKKANRKNSQNQSEDEMEIESTVNIVKETQEKSKKKKFSFVRLYNKLREIFRSEKSLEEKINKCLFVLFEECYSYVAEFFKLGDYLDKILSIFSNG